MTYKQRQTFIDEMLFKLSIKENDFPVISDLNELPDKFKGICMEINDHGNIEIWRVFKNGKLREIASRV